MASKMNRQEREWRTKEIEYLNHLNLKLIHFNHSEGDLS